jgi:hypothetical protein
MRRRLFQSPPRCHRDSSPASARQSCGSTTGGRAVATCAAFASKISSPPDERVWVRDLRMLRQGPEPRRELPVAAPIQRIEERAPGERLLRLGRVGERRLHRAQEQVCDAARGDRSRGGLELPNGELLLREPGRGITLAGDDAIMLRRIPRGHVRELIDRAAFGTKLRGIVARRVRCSPVDAPGVMSAGGHQRVEIIRRAVLRCAGLGSRDRWRARRCASSCRAARGGVPSWAKNEVSFFGGISGL